MSPSFSIAPVPIRVKPSRHFPFLARHPWVHAHALADLGEGLAAGQVVDLLDHDGNWLARGLVNPGSRLRVRLYTFDSGTAIDDSLWNARIDAAIARRKLMSADDSVTEQSDGGIDIAGATDARRLIFSESDLLSGVIVDQYADCLSVHFTSGGLLRWRDSLLAQLKLRTNCRAIKVRVDEKTAKHEQLDVLDEWYGDDVADGPLEYQQNGLRLSADLRTGQKTGGYLDQNLNHGVAANYLRGRKVLDVCCYQGGFGLVAAAAGAESVLGVDSSAAALEAAQANAARNGLTNLEFEQADCFDFLKKMASEGRTFGGLVLDPPRFAGSRHQIDAAMRAYRRLNSLAVDLLEPGGILVTCSCSGRVSRADFMAMLSDVGKRRRREMIVLENRGPSPDHPVAVSCPESEYLKCVIMQVV